MLDFLLIHALLLQNLYVQIYALFPQNFCDWNADSANFCAFRMYAYDDHYHMMMIMVIWLLSSHDDQHHDAKLSHASHFFSSSGLVVSISNPRPTPSFMMMTNRLQFICDDDAFFVMTRPRAGLQPAGPRWIVGGVQFSWEHFSRLALRLGRSAWRG